MNKIIGIFGWKVGDNSFGVTTPYLDFAEQYGSARIISPKEPIDDRLDLLIVPGGADVDPNRYNAIPGYWTSKSDPIKEYLETKVLPQYIERGIPIFGICRGIQSIAVLFGAKLFQHMWHETCDEDRNDLVHEIVLTNTTFKTEYEETFGKKKIRVNSMHHQCVLGSGFPDVLEVLGTYEGKVKYPFIEVLRHRTLPIYGVQYHPEELGRDDLSEFIMITLLQTPETNA